MIPVQRAVAVAALLMLGAPPAGAAAPAAPAALNALRAQCIAAANAEAQQEAAVAGLQRQVELLLADAAGRARDIADSQPQQVHLLGVLAFLARNRVDPLVGVDETPVDRQRGAMLIRSVAPELHAEAQALVSEIAEIGRLKREASARQPDFAAAEATLAADRGRLARLLAQRLAATGALLPDAWDAAALRQIGERAQNLGDLIRLADAAAERRDRLLAAQHGSDPTRPAPPLAFDPPQSALQMPVFGTITRHFGAPETDGTPSQGLTLAAALPGAEVVAPFGGQVIFVGVFRSLGPLLIIRNGATYHFVLAGLDSIGVVTDEWVAAGEPVGAMAQATSPPAALDVGVVGGPLYFEVRRSGQPVDPQSWLAEPPAGRETANGEQRVRQ
jgi:murein hydrolase activator